MLHSITIKQQQEIRNVCKFIFQIELKYAYDLIGEMVKQKSDQICRIILRIICIDNFII